MLTVAPAEFIAYLSLFNLYCWVLGFIYLPSAGLVGTGTRDRIGMIRLEDEEIVPTTATTTATDDQLEMDNK